MGDFVLDQDVFIPSGVPATPVQVAAMVVDPDHPLTVAEVPLLVEPQQPTVEQFTEAAQEAGVPVESVLADLADAGITPEAG